MTHPMDVFQKHLMTILDARPENLTNEVRHFIIQFFTKIKTPPVLLRQRTFIMMLLVNEYNKIPAYRSYVNKIIEEILQCVSTFLDSQDADYKSSLATVELTSMGLVDDTIPIIIKLNKPGKFICAVKALYKISNEYGDMAVAFKRILKGLVEDSPDAVVEWIDNLHFDDFKKEFFDDLIVSIMVNVMDLKALLIKDNNDARKVVEFLDKALDRKNNKGELFIQLRCNFTDAQIVKKITKLAKDYEIDTLIHCPIAVRKRRMTDYIYNMHLRSKEETAQLTEDCMDIMSSYEAITALSIWEKKDKFAGVAFGRLYGLSEEELSRICPDYKNVVKWGDDKIKAKMEELSKTLDKEEYVDVFDLEDNYPLYLIDDLEKLEFAMKILGENDTLAFDIEASYVCQNVKSVSEACLLQIAFKDCVLLIDIYILVKRVSDEDIRTFFEMFFGKDMVRICFDIKSDLDYLRETFEWMKDYVQYVQPVFHCVQRFVKFIHGNEAYKGIFEQLSTPSLAEVASKWFEKDLSKVQRQSNWLKRPLTKDQMVYAAMDARHTLDAYYYIQSKLSENNLIERMDKLVVKPEMVDRKKTRAKLGQKESMEEILTNVGNEIKTMHETLYNLENPQNITIVVDFAFLFITPFLRQFGYKTYDQRDIEDGEHLSRDEVINTLSKFLQNRINDGSISHCYLLTDSNSNLRFTIKVDIDESQIINCGIDETESSIICAIMSATKTAFDLKDIPNRCSKCGKSEKAIDFPADIFRLIYIRYAQFKQFFEKLKCEDNSAELCKRLANEKIIKLDNKWMIYNINDKCAVGFYLGGEEIMGRMRYVNEAGEIDEEKKKYKCNTRLFETLGDKTHIRFCIPCFEFF